MAQTVGHRPFGDRIKPFVITGGDQHGATPTSSLGPALGLQSGHDPTIEGSADASKQSSRMFLKDASYFSLCSNNPPLDQGQVLVATTSEGSVGDGLVLGVPPSVPNNEGNPGNFNLFSAFMQFVMKQDPNVNRAPNLIQQIIKGARVLLAQEKGKHFHGLYNGVPTNGILGSLLGGTAPNEKNIPTAIQKFANILTSGMMNSMPGTGMSMGQMLSSLNSNPQSKSEITNGKPKEFEDAFNSITELAQTVDMGSGYSVTGFRVNEPKFYENAVNMLRECQSLHDLDTCLQELQSNTALHGFDINEILILDLDNTANGDFLIGEDVYQYSTETANNIQTKISIGKVKSWEKDQRILEINNPVKTSFNGENNVFNINETVIYPITSYQYFNDASCTDILLETPYGNTTLCIDCFGAVREKVSNTAFQQEQSQKSEASNPSSAQSASASNFFGQSSGVMMDMFSRLSGGQFSQALQQLQKLNGNEEIFKKIREKTKGGNFFSAASQGK